jgi:hypothetical protein
MSHAFMSNASNKQITQTLRGYLFSSTIGHYRLAIGCTPGSDSVPPLTVRFGKPCRLPAFSTLHQLLVISIVRQLASLLVPTVHWRRSLRKCNVGKVDLPRLHNTMQPLLLQMTPHTYVRNLLSDRACNQGSSPLLKPQ